MEVKGKIDKVGEVQVISDKFKKREIWLTTQEDYPQTLNIQISQDKADEFNGKEGDDVTLGINLRGRKWTNKDGKEMVFNSIEAWRWELHNESTPENSAPSINEEDDDLLPF